MKARILVVTVATALTLSSCSSQPAQAAEICVDPTTNIRVDDSMCAHPIIPGAFVHWYVMPTYTIPAYGWPAQYGYATPPRHTVIVNNVQSSGGVIEKRNRFSRNTAAPTVKPTSAATQAPPPKKQSWGQSKPATQPANKSAQSRPQTQSKPASQPKWNTYKPPASKPVAPRPPTYGKYR